MFFHTMKYTLLNLLRDKGQVFWCVAFPLLLGTMFHFAFGGLGSGESFSAIPVAVVMQEESSELRSMLDSLSKPGEDQFLEVTCFRCGCQGTAESKRSLRHHYR